METLADFIGGVLMGVVLVYLVLAATAPLWIDRKVKR